MNKIKTNYKDILIIRRNILTNEIEVIFNDLYGDDILDTRDLLPEIKNEIEKLIF